MSRANLGTIAFKSLIDRISVDSFRKLNAFSIMFGNSSDEGSTSYYMLAIICLIRSALYSDGKGTLSFFQYPVVGVWSD